MNEQEYIITELRKLTKAGEIKTIIVDGHESLTKESIEKVDGVMATANIVGSHA